MSKKPLRVQVTVTDGMVNIETPGLKDEDDFYFTALFDNHGRIDMTGMQANHEDPEWPELKDKLFLMAKAAIAAYKEFNN